MKSVVMIAYDFPPEGHAGVYRPLRFVRHLPLFDWQPTVISAGGTEFARYDPGLLTQIPATIDVIRPTHRLDWWQRFQQRRAQRARVAPTSRPDGTVAAGVAPRQNRARAVARAFVRRAEACWYQPDMQAGWIQPAVDAVRQVCARQRPDVIWVTGPPWSSFIAAAKASEQTGVPYVLDFRTSWTIVPSPSEALRPRWLQKRDRRVLRRLLQNAQAVTFFYHAEAECFWRMYSGALDASRIHVIPNGFDGDIEAVAPRETRKLTALYTGTLSDYRYDTFLAAVALFVARHPECAEHLAVKFVGEQEPEFIAQLEELGLRRVVSVHPPMPHAEVLALQTTVDVLLMLERTPVHKGYELLAGAKLFGYMKAGRPILGVVPAHGEAARILREVGVSTIADAESVEEICGVLERLFKAWRHHDLDSLAPVRAACARYSSTAQTQALVRALEGAPAQQPFVPGSMDIVPSLRSDVALATRG